MKLIDISTPKYPNTYTKVDDADFDWLNKRKWNIDRYGYARRTNHAKGGKTIYMHRALLSAQAGEIGDHINGDRLDNQKHNLRLCTSKENAQNQKKKNHSGVRPTSRYKGVSWDQKKKRFRARIRVNGKRIDLGRYHSEDLAGAAYQRAEKLHFGDFARINHTHNSEC